jgi:hypothetical protein
MTGPLKYTTFEAKLTIEVTTNIFRKILFMIFFRAGFMNRELFELGHHLKFTIRDLSDMWLGIFYTTPINYHKSL